jgi:hypothetical protein
LAGRIASSRIPAGQQVHVEKQVGAALEFYKRLAAP